MWKYNKEKHTVDEQPTMKTPLTAWFEHDKAEEFGERQAKYNEHIASLRSVPVQGIVDWKDGQEVAEGKDFKIYRCYREQGDKEYLLIAIPIKQEQPQL